MADRYDELIPYLNALDNVLYYIALDHRRLVFVSFIGFVAFLTALILFEEPISIIATNISAWECETNEEYTVLFQTIFVKYVLYSIPTFFVKQREFIYSIIKFKNAHFVMDTFLAPTKVYYEIDNGEWGTLAKRFLVYHCVVWYYNATFKIIQLYIFSIVVRICYENYLDYRRRFEATFDFSALPYPIQQRFYELQEPATKTRLSNAFFYQAMFPIYAELTIDRLYLRKAEKCHKLYYAFAYHKSPQLPSQPYKQILALCCSTTKTKCECPFRQLKKVRIVHGICGKKLEKNMLSKFIARFDYSNIKLLVLMESHLNERDFRLISQMKLSSIILSLGHEEDVTFDDKMVAVLDVVIGIPHLRLGYMGELRSPNKFEVHLVEWVLKHGYVESLVCTSENPNNVTFFQSSPNLEPFDAPDM